MCLPQTAKAIFTAAGKGGATAHKQLSLTASINGIGGQGVARHGEERVGHDICFELIIEERLGDRDRSPAHFLPLGVVEDDQVVVDVTRGGSPAKIYLVAVNWRFSPLLWCCRRCLTQDRTKETKRN